MRLRATYVGEVAGKILGEKSRVGVVHHVFPNTLYIGSKDSLIVLTRKGFRAPMNIGLPRGGAPLSELVEVGCPARFEEGVLKVGGLEVVVDGAPRYRLRLMPLEADLRPLGKYLRIAGLMVDLLYQVSPRTLPHLPETEEFTEFLEDVVAPYIAGDEGALMRVKPYLKLLGLGEGFTPSGDDFLSGFIPTINLLTGSRLHLDESLLMSSTSWASGVLLNYAQKGLVDEVTAGVIRSAAVGDGESFVEGVLTLTRRGHISGLDIALGVLTAVSAAREKSSRDGVIWNIFQGLIKDLEKSLLTEAETLLTR